MVNKKFLKTSLISSILFFIILSLIDLIITRQLNDGLFYIILLVGSFVIFGPIIAILVSDYRDEHKDHRWRPI